MIFKYTNITKCNVFYSKVNTKGSREHPKGAPSECETVRRPPSTRSSRLGTLPQLHTCKEKAPVYGQKKRDDSAQSSS